MFYFERGILCLLRKPSLNSDILDNYYLISNFLFGGKVIQHIFALNFRDPREADRLDPFHF